MVLHHLGRVPTDPPGRVITAVGNRGSLHYGNAKNPYLALPPSGTYAGFLFRCYSPPIYWTEENAEAVFQLRAAVVSGRWDEIFEHTQEAMARDRRKTWRWTPPDCLAELKALEAEDDEMSQTPDGKTD